MRIRSSAVVPAFAVLVGLAAPSFAGGPVLVRSHDDAGLFAGIFVHARLRPPHDVHDDLFGDGNWSTDIGIFGSMKRPLMNNLPHILEPERLMLGGRLRHDFALHGEPGGPNVGLLMFFAADLFLGQKIVSRTEKEERSHGEHTDSGTYGLAGVSQDGRFLFHLLVVTAAHTTEPRWFVCHEQAVLEGSRPADPGASGLATGLTALVVDAETGLLVVAAGVGGGEMSAVTVHAGTPAKPGILLAESAASDIESLPGVGGSALVRRKLDADSVRAVEKSGAVVSVSTTAGTLRAAACATPTAEQRQSPPP